MVDNTEAASGADTVALVVKPQDMGEVLTEIAPHLHAGQVLVSLAAGITTDYIEKHIPDGIAVVRVMPNTPALVDEGMAAISAGTHCDECERCPLRPTALPPSATAPASTGWAKTGGRTTAVRRRGREDPSR